MNRTFTGFIMGIPVTFLIFVLMSFLIKTEAHTIEPVIEDSPDLRSAKYDFKLNTKKPIRHLPDQKQLEEIPDNPNVPDDNRPPIEVIDPIDEITAFPDNYQRNIDGSSKPDNIFNQGSNEAVPMLITEPRWPGKATTDGFVRLCFTIMPDGKPANINVVDSAPGKVFVRSAKKAVYKWKFKPSSENGVKVAQHNMCYTMNYRLGNN